MQLSHKEDETSNEKYNQVNALQTRIESLEINIELEQKEISSLNFALEKLNNDFKITCLYMVISAVLLMWILSNPHRFLMNIISRTYVTIMIFGGIVSFVGYTVRRVMNHVPMYIHCKQEEKGGSSNLNNYVYQIKRHERMKADYIKELEIKKQELDNLLEK
ncbi:MAG: hypothetical protein K2G45_13000 [Lachnospiraceae bacterium]|nr:hypothetical protein [Lachnospiraceae bacterium]